MIEMQHGANNDTDPAITAATTDPPKKTPLPMPQVSGWLRRSLSTGEWDASGRGNRRSSSLSLERDGFRASLELLDRGAQPLMLLAQALRRGGLGWVTGARRMLPW